MTAKKTRGFKMGDRVEVEWIDSSSYAGWRNKVAADEALEKTLKCSTIGYWFEAGSDRVGIHQSYSYDDEGNIQSASELIVIPRVAIKSMRKLK